MKKILLFTAAATMAVSTFAAAPTFQWGKLIDSAQSQDLSAKVVVTTDGNPVTLSQFGSRSTTDNISYDGQVIATGGETVGNSDNLNLLVIKHNAIDGSLVWAVSSRNGDFSVSSASNMVATADGGVLVLVNARSSNLGAYTSPVLVDNSGNEVSFAEWNTSVWIYNQVLVKISAEGNIEWARDIVMDQLPVPAASTTSALSATTNGVTPYALTVDADGNIFIGGNYRAPMILNGAGYSTYVLTPRNISTYNGDTQSSAGGMYVISLDSEGNYLNHLRTSGELTRDQACLFYVDGSNMYIVGNASGNADDVLTVGDKSVTLQNSYDGFFVANVATSLKTVNYLTYVKAFPVSEKQNTKLRAVKVINNKLYVVGGGTGGYGTADSTEALVASTGKTDEGWFIVMNTDDGSWLGAANNATNIGAYLDIFEYDGKIYVYGYRLNAADGTFLDEYTEGIYTRTERYTVAKGGGAPTGYSAAFNASSKTIFTLTRGNKAFTFGDNSESAAPTSWGGLLATYKFEDTSSAVAAVREAENGLEVKGSEGNVEIISTDAVDVTIVNAAGQTVATLRANPGTTNCPLPAGIYLVNNQKVVVR